MKKLSFFLMAMLFSVMSFAAETVAYTLTPAATGSNSSPHNAYASAADWTYQGITWNVTGNSYMVPWRIGGKSITNVDRAVYTKTALAADVTKIEITHGTVSCTLNSCTLIVSDAANGAGETFAVTVAQNTTTTITLPEGDYSNKFYKLVYNVTNTSGSNKFVQLSEIKFYTEVQTSIEAPTFTPEEGKVDANNTFAEPFALTIASATEGATIKYTLDGTDPALETALTYEAPITISTMVQVRAIAVKGEETSVEATATYIVASTEEKPYTASEAITAQSLGLAASVYVTGTVKTIEEISTQYGNATYNITDGVKELKIYRGKNLGNAKFTSEDQLLVGDVVVVKGDLTSYNGAAQLGQNNYLISRIPAVVNHMITVSANPAEAGTVTGGGEYEETDEITVKAVANDGYDFVNWTENDVEVSTEANYSFAVLADRNLVANFKKSVVTHDFYAEGVTVSEGGWSINLLGSWNEQAFTVMLWQDNTQGFGTYAADAETGYTATLGVKELTPTAPGYYTDMQDGTFTFQGTMTDGTDIYEVFLKGALASSTGTGELEAKNEVYFTYEDGEWMIEAFADDQTWGLMLAVSAETDPETGENLVYGQYVTDIEAGITEEVAGTCQLYFDDFSGCYVFKGGLATASGNIYPTLYASSLSLMTNELMTGASWVGEFAGVDYYEVLMMAADYSWELDLHARNCTGANGTYTVDVVDEAEGAYSTFMGSTIVTGELTIEDGMYEANVTTVDSEGNPAMSISVLAWAAAAEEYDIVITDATVTDNTSGYNIDLTGEWEGHDIKVEVCDELTAETILANFFIDGGIANDGDQAEGTVEATVNEGVVTITGTFECLGSGAVYNVTISGTLPVAEPETITWELNGGEVAAVVPTNEELWEAFKPYYNTYYGLERADQPITAVASFASAKMQEIMTDPESEYKWLGDYVLSVAAEQGVTVDSELTWRFSVHTFFNAEKRTAYPSNVPDFTEAGKPENWGPAYQAAHEVVLPTEPVEEDYVLPTPVKEGYTFVGWYDNADGEGEAMTVLPAGWAGTLYAIWKVEGPATALENIAVEGKAVKAIVNGQLIIIKNGVQYNAQGQVIK